MTSASDVHKPVLSDVAVIIATRNEGKTLRACVESVLISAREAGQIIIVDDGSTDDSGAILKSFGNKITVLQEGGNGPGRARNLGMQATKRRYIAFTDGDCVVAEGWLERLCEALAGQPLTVSSAGGIQQVSTQAESTERTIGEFLASVGFVSDYLHGAGKSKLVTHNPTCNVLYDRQAIERAGGFDETLWPCEDLELDLRLKELGYRAFFTPSAVVEHRRPGTYGGFFQMMKRYGFAHAQLVKKRGICQPMHVLSFIVLGVLTELVVWRDIRVTVLFLCAGILFFAFRTLSPTRALQFTLLSVPAVGMWVFGFYSGLIGKRRIAKHV